jgi:putative transport protein
MRAMVELLVENPLLLLFVVAGLGYPLGRVRVGGFSLGVAAVLFVGLGIGALDPRLRLPELVYLLGLVIFVFTIGLASGPGFFASFGRQGLRQNLLVLGVLLVGAGVTVGLALLFGLGGPAAAGLFAGSLTNTPALAGLGEELQHSGRAGLETEPVVAYSIAYPIGVIGVILALFILQRLWRVDYAKEAQRLRDLGASGEHLADVTVRVTRPRVCGRSIQELRAEHRWRVIFGRFSRGDEVGLVQANTELELGDQLTVVGAAEELERVVAVLGELGDAGLALERARMDFRRMFVSSPAVAGKRLRDLHLIEKYGALVTRVRRGDSDMLPTGAMRLELGDRVRVLTRRDRLDDVTRFFGDSYRALSEVDAMSFGLGIALGLLVGLIPIPLPGGMTFRLGIAGGPLVVALVLSAVGRTGPLLWQLPYSANLTLRQVGLILFLAGVGTRSGYAFASTLASGEGLVLFGAGALITCVAALLVLVVGHKLLGVPMSLLGGVLAGQHTQPAVLGFASEQTGNDLPNIGYATVYPLATVMKILLAQVVLTVLPAL